jgi:hypothetical protein
MTTTTITLEPLSAQTHPWQLLRHYGPERPDTAVRKNGDQMLLAELEEAVTRHDGWGLERPTVAELPILELDAAVVDVEMRVKGWRVAGEEGQPILERLDEHFRPLQEAWAEHRREENERHERRAREEQQRAEENGRLWRRHRLSEMVAEAAAMGGVEELRELLDERAALEATG